MVRNIICPTGNTKIPPPPSDSPTFSRHHLQFRRTACSGREGRHEKFTASTSQPGTTLKRKGSDDQLVSKFSLSYQRKHSLDESDTYTALELEQHESPPLRCIQPFDRRRNSRSTVPIGSARTTVLTRRLTIIPVGVGGSDSTLDAGR